MDLLLYCALLVASRLSISSSSEFPCSISESPVPEGNSASITCIYPEDLREKKSFYVYRDDLNGSQNQKTVLRCDWKENSTNPNCTPKPGYQVRHYRSRVRLLIQSVVKAQEGRYSCQFSGVQGSVCCTLEVQESGFKTSCDAPPVTMGEPGGITCFFNKNLTEVKAEFSVIRQPLATDETDTDIVVLDCFWPDGRLDCWAFDGYTVDPSKISSMLTLRIANSSEEQEGHYTCKVSSSHPGIHTPCDFRLKEEHEDRDVCEVHNCHPQHEKPCDFKLQTADGDGCPTAWTIFGVCLGSCTVAFLIAIGIGLFILKRLGLEKRLRKICNPPAEESVPLRNSGSPRSTETRREREGNNNEDRNQ